MDFGETSTPQTYTFHEPHADGRTERFRIGSDLTQRGGGAAQEQIVKGGGVGAGAVAERRRQREHHVVVFDWQPVLRLLLEPAGAGQGLALGTMTVAAGVIGHARVGAVDRKSVV